MEISDEKLASALIKVKDYDISFIPDNNEIEHIFSSDFENKMNMLILSIDRKEKSDLFIFSAIKRVAVIILILCISVFSFMMINPQARADLKNAVIEFYETHLKFYFITANEEADDFTSIAHISAGYIPQGFELKEKYEEFEAVGYNYENETENLSFDIYISHNNGLAIHTDNDKNNIEYIMISNREAYLISGKNEGKPYSTLIITGSKITITIFGQLKRQEIIKIGESINEV